MALKCSKGYNHWVAIHSGSACLLLYYCIVLLLIVYHVGSRFVGMLSVRVLYIF